jgi:hypothetical protein
MTRQQEEQRPPEISEEEVKRILERVTQIAAMADLHVERHPEAPDMLVAGFDMGGGRKQTIFIRYIGQTPDGHNCISFMSPCQEVKRGLLGGGLSKGAAVDLLRRNSVLPFGAFALAQVGKADVLMVISNQIVETMEIEEMKAHMGFVTGVADAYEQELGVDDF